MGLLSRRKAVLGSIAIGVGMVATGASDQISGHRATNISTAEDDTAFISLRGLGEGDVPEIQNQFSTACTVTLAVPSDHSTEFDIGNTGSFESGPVSFSLSAGETREWAVSADTDPVSVEIFADVGHSAVELTRNVAVPQAGQFKIIENVDSTGASGAFSFTLRNEGSRDAFVTGIRVDETSTDAVEVSNGDIFVLDESEFGDESPRQLISDPLEVGASTVTRFDDDDIVVIPDTEEPLTFEFDRFRNSPGPGSPNADMRGEIIWVTLSFEDGSQRQFEINDS